MVLTAGEPIRGLFDDEDRRIAAELLRGQEAEIEQRQADAESEEVERDRRILDERDRLRLEAGSRGSAVGRAHRPRRPP